MWKTDLARLRDKVPAAEEGLQPGEVGSGKTTIKAETSPEEEPSDEAPVEETPKREVEDWEKEAETEQPSGGKKKKKK